MEIVEVKSASGFNKKLMEGFVDGHDLVSYHGASVIRNGSGIKYWGVQHLPLDRIKGFALLCEQLNALVKEAVVGNRWMWHPELLITIPMLNSWGSCWGANPHHLEKAKTERGIKDDFRLWHCLFFRPSDSFYNYQMGSLYRNGYYYMGEPNAQGFLIRAALKEAALAGFFDDDRRRRIIGGGYSVEDLLSIMVSTWQSLWKFPNGKPTEEDVAKGVAFAKIVSNVLLHGPTTTDVAVLNEDGKVREVSLCNLASEINATSIVSAASIVNTNQVRRD